MELKIDTYNHRFDKQDIENRQQFFVTGFFFSFYPLLLCKVLRQEPSFEGQYFYLWCLKKEQKL